MENFQEYIESGRLEQYVLGELSAAERAEVEAWAARSPEVRQELLELQAGLGLYAEAQAMTPPAGLRERVLGRVLTEINQGSAAEPAAAPTLRVSASNPDRAAAPVAEAPARRSGLWAIAASVALVLSLAGNALLYSRWQQTSNELAALQAEQTRFAANARGLQQQLASSQQQLTSSQQQLHVLRSPDQYRLVALAGTPAHPQARARVLFDRASHRVYLDVQQLPPLPAGKQYQLWALYQGKPIDAGVLTAATARGDSLQQMKDIASAQTFAMTVEPAGGSANPTLKTMTVVGNI